MATFLDIFAGIGGMRRGLESAGHRCVGYIEWDKYARKSYEAIFDTKGEWTASDVTTVRATELPTADIWTFGFPCQDLSVAGRQLGFSGNRSSLFFTVVDLLREAGPDRPEWLIAENVMGFFSSNRGYDFLAAQVALDEIGYDVEWEVFNATQFGIPQNRQRVFLVGHLRSRGRREVFPLRIDDSKACKESGNVRIQDEVIGFETAFGNSNGSPVFTGVMRCLDGQQSKGVIEPPQLKMIGLLDMKGNECIRRVYDPTGLSPTLTTMEGGHREPKIVHRVGNTNPSGHGMNGNVYDSNGLAPTVTTNKGEGHKMLIGTRIRKLTPLECWRLMGRSDADFHAAKNAGVSDTQLYKQAGNSLIPQIVQAIGERIAELSESEVITA